MPICRFVLTGAYGMLSAHRPEKNPMTVKHTTSYTDEAYAHAQTLAQTGEYACSATIWVRGARQSG